MKASTKAKRRAVLALLGLGMLDETEIETIPNAKKIDTLQPPKAKLAEDTCEIALVTEKTTPVSSERESKGEVKRIEKFMDNKPTTTVLPAEQGIKPGSNNSREDAQEQNKNKEKYGICEKCARGLHTDRKP